MGFLSRLFGCRGDASVAKVNVNREWIVSELRQLLVALASPGEVALEHAPAGSCRPDELALDYDNFVHTFVGNFVAEISSQQRSALLGVDELLGSGSDPEQLAHAAFLTEQRRVS